MKKRFFLLLALTAALLLALGMSTAMATTADDGHEHWAWCYDPSVCAVCGAPYSGSNVRHGIAVYQYTETECWAICDRCFQEMEGYQRSEHTAACNNPGVCCRCGQPYSGSNISHQWNWQYTETEHRQICSQCGEEQNRGPHIATCVNPGVCAICGVPYNGIWHRVDYKYDETNHWQYCTLCGEILEQGEHVAACNAPNVCAVCGAPYSGDNIEHDWSDWQYTETECWQVCNLCGAERWRSEHWAACDNPGVCCYCGAPYSGSNVEHDFAYQYNDTDHWQVCSRCGIESARSIHGAWCDDPNVCAWCGAPYSGDNIDHDWTDYQYDETDHWAHCSRCGIESDRSVHGAWCDNPGVCAWCGAPYFGDNIGHDWSDWQYNETECWRVCLLCGEKTDEGEHWAACDNPGVCYYCGQPYSGSNIGHYYDDEVGIQYLHDETNHWYLCSECGEKYNIEAHTFGDDGVCTVCEYSNSGATAAPTDAPTTAPTEAPTEAPTTAPTDAPTDAPTEQPADKPTNKPHEHVFRTFVSQGDGTHRSDCEGCGTFTVKSCELQNCTVNGISCRMCGVCGYTTVPELAGIELPEEAMANVTAATAAGEAAPVQVFDVTPALPENTVMALCLRIVPETGAAMPSSVQISVPCTLDTANMRLVFIADGEKPLDVPFAVVDGQLVFTVTAPGFFALVSVQA